MIYFEIKIFLSNLTNSEKILSIDYGIKKTGLAITNPFPILAIPYKLITHNSVANLIIEIENIINSEKISSIIIGLPKTLDNQEHLHAQDVHKIADYLSQNFKILLLDERMTTKMSNVLIKNTLSTKNLSHKDRKNQQKMIKKLQLNDDKNSALLMLNEILDLYNKIT